MNAPIAADAADAAAAALRTLPPFPVVASKFIAAMQAPDPMPSELARLVALDPALTASVLKLVNSPFYGLQRRIGSVQEAVLALGLSTVYRVVLSAAVIPSLRTAQLDAAALRRFWWHQLAAAVIARRLLADAPGGADLAFTAALLHDVGQLALMHHRPADYAALFECGEHGDGAPRVLAERARFGFDHAQLGARLLERWRLPAAIVEAVAHHHDAAAASHASVTGAVWRADRIAGAVAAGAACPGEGDVPANFDAAAAAREIELMEGLLR